jgi:myo-inositol-1(or 4)-monophosphatase
MTSFHEAQESIEIFAEFAAELAAAGGATAKRWFRTACNIDVKADHSPVTIADRRTESHLRQCIQARFPDHGLLGEEYGQENSDSEYVWSIDPIDGTRSFITGSPIWGTLVALLHNGHPIVGATDLPVLGERWLAFNGGGCWHTANGDERHRCWVSNCRELGTARFYTTSPQYFSPVEKPVMQKLTESVGEARFGGDCYSYCLLASGFIDLVVESQLHHFDYMPLITIVQEAGGVITDWQGNPLSVHSGERIVAAATPELHWQTLQLLAPVK